MLLKFTDQLCLQPKSLNPKTHYSDLSMRSRMMYEELSVSMTASDQSLCRVLDKNLSAWYWGLSCFFICALCDIVREAGESDLIIIMRTSLACTYLDCVWDKGIN